MTAKLYDTVLIVRVPLAAATGAVAATVLHDFAAGVLVAAALGAATAFGGKP